MKILLFFQVSSTLLYPDILRNIKEEWNMSVSRFLSNNSILLHVEVKKKQQKKLLCGQTTDSA